MADSVILDRTPVLQGEETVERSISMEEAKHAEKMKELYDKYIRSETPYIETEQPEAIVIPSASERIADYRPIAPKKELFAGYEFKDGELVRPAEAVEAVSAPVEMEEDDARPTRRTMDTLARGAALARAAVAMKEEERVSFFASLSKSAKIALAVVAAALVVLVSLICMNTAIINSLDADILFKREQLETLMVQSEEIRSQLDWVQSPENVADFAENVLGMIHP